MLPFEESVMPFRCQINSLRVVTLAAAFATSALPGQEKPTSPDPQPIKRIQDLELKVPSFTFVRLKYSVDPHNPGHGGNDRWSIDYPESDRKFTAWFEKKTG